MRKIEKINKKIVDYLFDHYVFGAFLKLTIDLIISAAAGILFAFGFVCFISSKESTLVTGGVSGICQNIVMISELCKWGMDPNKLQSILYFAINIPILLFAFFKISKRFALMSVVVVGCSSLFITLFNDTGVANTIQSVEFIKTSPLTRALFAGVCTGVSSSIAFKIDSSSGGVDVLTYYLGMKKSSQIGKYGVIANSIVVAFYFILLLIGNPSKWGNNLVLVLYSIIYLFVVALVIDMINIRNKKVQINITTTKSNMSDILVSVFPHGGTIYHVNGAYSGKDENVVSMVVSSTEVNRVCRIVRRIDPSAFIVASPVNRVYGNFFSKPVE